MDETQKPERDDEPLTLEEADADLADARANLNNIGKQIIDSWGIPGIRDSLGLGTERIKVPSVAELAAERIMNNPRAFDELHYTPLDIPEPDDSPQRTAAHTAAVADQTRQMAQTLEILAAYSEQNIAQAKEATARAERAEKWSKVTTVAALIIAGASLAVALVTLIVTFD